MSVCRPLLRAGSAPRASYIALAAPICAALLAACGTSGPGPSGPVGAAPNGQTGTPPAQGVDKITLRGDVEPIRSLDEALQGVFIPPFVDCRDPLPGDVALSGGQVCTPVSISGNTEPGKYYPDYASCEIVRRQRPYWSAEPASVAELDDPRLDDATYMAELAWAKEQVAASGCTCCHDSRLVPAGQWDIAAEPIWIDSLSDTGLALFAGLADSRVLGAYPPEDNFGFARDVTGVPSTDPERMQAFMLAEMARRGLSEEWGRAVPPFGGPIYTNSIQQPVACAAGQGVDPEGVVRWTGGEARYVYVQQADAANPGVPPNLDSPEGTLWRLDVLASQPALASGVAYGTTPAGSFQYLPETSPAPALNVGTQYKLVVLLDMGVPIVNCHFTFGQPLPLAAADAGAPAVDADGGIAPGYGYGEDAGAGSDAGASGACTLAGGDARGFGAPCSDTENHSDCPCEANYCSKSPFDAQGYCTSAVDSCDGDTSVCPSGWGCFDVSVFQAGAPSLCSKP